MNARQQKLATLTDEQRAQLYVRVFTSEEGQLVLEDLKSRANFYGVSFRADSHETAFNEGTRALLLTILTQSTPLDRPLDNPQETTVESTPEA